MHEGRQSNRQTDMRIAGRQQPGRRQTDRETTAEAGRITDRHTDTQTHRHTDTQTHRHTDTQTHRPSGRPAEGQTHRRQADGWIDR